VDLFDDRVDAGRQLADALAPLELERPVVLGLPRGGVPVAAVVAQALTAELDVLYVRKVGAPQQPELAIGAVGEDDVCVRNEDVLAVTRIGEARFAELAAAEYATLHRSADRMRRVRPAVALAERCAVIVDDGVATGATVLAACQVARARRVDRLLVAAPVAAAESVELLRTRADDVVCVLVPPPGRFGGVARFYRDFSPVTDAEVEAWLTT
jgi:putative phosphoribosyl transferase